MLEHGFTSGMIGCQVCLTGLFSSRMLRLVINHQRLRLSWWNVLDLNQRKTGYEPVALTTVLTFHMAEQRDASYTSLSIAPCKRASHP